MTGVGRGGTSPIVRTRVRSSTLPRYTARWVVLGGDGLGEVFVTTFLAGWAAVLAVGCPAVVSPGPNMAMSLLKKREPGSFSRPRMHERLTMPPPRSEEAG